MADLNLNSKGDLEVLQITEDPVVIPGRVIDNCNSLALEDNKINSLNKEDNFSFCLEDSSGELTVIEDTTLGEPAVYEMGVTSDNTTTLLKRALQTPIGHLTMFSLQDETINLVDNLYGNDVYKELSEGLTLNFIARVRNHIINAINRANLQNKVSDVQVSVSDNHTIQIHVFYTDNTPTTVIPIRI